MEADVFPLRQPGLSDQIDGAIGERSMFHQTFGYYVHGVSENTAALPHGWRERLIKVQNENTGVGSGGAWNRMTRRRRSLPPAGKRTLGLSGSCWKSE